MKKVLITGSAGFIGSALSHRLLKKNYEIIGIDNLNNYYDPQIKEDRLNLLQEYDNYLHHRVDITNNSELEKIFQETNLDCIVHLAAQAGVRNSIEEPKTYTNTNIVGFANILELTRNLKISNLIYASSSSVYGNNTKLPFSTKDRTDNPASYYGATKKANEIMASSYSHLYGFNTTGLRFFTVYGPWGRPDMALFHFTNCIVNKKPIPVFNNGKHRRDFTFVDDIVSGIENIVEESQERVGLSRVYNIGNNNSVELMYFIKLIENELRMKAEIDFKPMQLGDVYETFADVDDLMNDFNFKPSTKIEDGIKIFIKWYKEYYKVDG